MDPNAGNPFMKGSNPYMQPEQEKTPVAGGDMPGGAPPTPGGGTSETTKPRQMPGGADPMAGGDMPLGPGGAGAPPPIAPSGVDQVTDMGATPQKMTQQAYRQRVQAIRREVMADNPEVDTRNAHRIAVAVVALQVEGAMGIPTITEMQQQREQRQQGRQQRQQNANQGDLNDPNHPYWQQNGGHPFASGTGVGPNNGGPQGSQYGGRNQLEDYALSRGYTGGSPEAWALGDKALNGAANGIKHLWDKRHGPRAPRPNSPGGRTLPS